MTSKDELITDEPGRKDGEEPSWHNKEEEPGRGRLKWWIRKARCSLWGKTCIAEPWWEEGQSTGWELTGGHRCTHSIHFVQHFGAWETPSYPFSHLVLMAPSGDRTPECSSPDDAMEALRSFSDQFLSHGASIRTTCFDPWTVMKKPF